MGTECPGPLSARQAAIHKPGGRRLSKAPGVEGPWTPPTSVPCACANDGGPAPPSAALSPSARRSSAARWRRRSRSPATERLSRRSRRPRLTLSAASRVPCAWKCSRSRCRCPADTCEWRAPAGEGARCAGGLEGDRRHLTRERGRPPRASASRLTGPLAARPKCAGGRRG